MLSKKMLIAAVFSAASLSSVASAHDDTFLGAVAGGAVGAAIGHGISGRGGAVVGGIIGAAAGASIADSNRYYRGDRYYSAAVDEETVVYDTPRYDARPQRYYSPAVVYEEAPVVYAPPTVVYTSRYAPAYDGYSYRDDCDRHEWRERRHRDHDDHWDRHEAHHRGRDWDGDHDRGWHGER